MTDSVDNKVDEVPDYFDMSDEDVMNSPPPEFTEETTTDEPEELDPVDEVEEPNTSEEDPTDDVEDNDPEEDDDKLDDSDSTDDDVEDKNEIENLDDKEDGDPKEEEPETELSEFEKKIRAPFKANGREMQVSNAEEAITLMQMGANYNKKMAGLKPTLKLMKMLDNNKLLDESKLSYLIDLDKKNPDAIAKLIKESGFDPLDDDNKADGSSYQPDTYTVDDSELELESTLDDIQGTAGYNETIKVIGTKWDESSRQVLLANPTIIRDINDQVSSGVYGKISAEVDRLKTFGKLQGMSDIQAYKAVGDMMDARGDFGTVAPVTKQTPPAVIKPKRKEADSKLNDRKRAASSTKSSPSKSKSIQAEFLNMPDDEFEKLGNAKFI